jgi:hypothetical protein
MYVWMYNISDLRLVEEPTGDLTLRDPTDYPIHTITYETYTELDTLAQHAELPEAELDLLLLDHVMKHARLSRNEPTTGRRINPKLALHDPVTGLISIGNIDTMHTYGPYHHHAPPTGLPGTVQDNTPHTLTITPDGLMIRAGQEPVLYSAPPRDLDRTLLLEAANSYGLDLT